MTTMSPACRARESTKNLESEKTPSNEAEPTEFEWLPRLAAADEPRRMTGKRHRDRPGTLFSTKASHGSSAVTSTIVVEQHLVDDCQYLAWVVVFDRGGPTRVSRERCDDRCIDTVAADVTDDNGPVIDRDLEDVVEIASDLVTGSCRPVHSSDIESWDLW